MSVLRYDIGTTSGVVVQDNGYIRASARLTRIGVFDYRDALGNLFRELRPPDEVFDAESLASFELVPLTVDHPVEAGAAVALDVSNTKKFQVGSVSDVKPEQEFVAGRVLITDEEAVTAVENGMRELSCGYRCDLVEEPGVTDGIPGIPDGILYDAVQRNIRGNHVALVEEGRAGPEVALRMDSGTGVMVTQQKNNGGSPQGGLPGINPGVTPMRKIRIDAVDYEMSEQAAQAVVKALSRVDELSTKIAELDQSVAKEKARADKAEEDLQEAKHKADVATYPESVRKLVDERVKLVREAQKILGDEKAGEVKIDDMSDLDIRKSVIVHVSPAAADKMKDADEAYVLARFDQAVETVASNPHSSSSDHAPPYMRALGSQGTNKREDADDVREKMVQRRRELGMKSLRAS